MVVKQNIEIIDLDDFNVSPNKISPKIRDYWKVVKKEDQKRITLFHYVVHFLAIFIVISYILLIFLNYEVPKEFSTIVSLVIGFYFAKSLFNNL